MLHDDLRKAREEAGLSQMQLAALAGIPRNQVSRAEKGDNITLDTLRKIVVHLPITDLMLVEKVNLKVDIFPQPEKVLMATEETVQQLVAATLTAIHAAKQARTAVRRARAAVPLPSVDGQGLAEIDTALLLRKLEHSMKELGTLAQSETA